MISFVYGDEDNGLGNKNPGLSLDLVVKSSDQRFT